MAIERFFERATNVGSRSLPQLCYYIVRGSNFSRILFVQQILRCLNVNECNSIWQLKGSREMEPFCRCTVALWAGIEKLNMLLLPFLKTEHKRPNKIL